MSEEEQDFDLLMPFVTVQSVGGPHDDNAYTAGWEMGSLDKTLTHLALTGGESMRAVLRHDNEAQADLIAMQHGYEMTVNIYDDEFWVGVEFTRAHPQAPDGGAA